MARDVSKKTLDKYYRQLRLIEEHRELKATANIRYYHNKLLKNLQEFIGVQYAQYAENDELTFAILQQKGQYARFLEEVETRINDISPKVSAEVHKAIEDTYELAYKGIVEGVQKAKTTAELRENFKGLKTTNPRTMKNAVSNKLMEDALTKNHKTILHDIKKDINIGLMNGDRMSTMANRISKHVNSDYYKSVRIARTEVHRVREAGHNDAATEINQILTNNDSDMVMVKVWRTMQDNRVRPQRTRKSKSGWKTSMGKGPNHMNMEGIVVLANDKFDLGDGHKALVPGSSGVAGHDINCRCFVEYELMTKAEYEKVSGKKIKSEVKPEPVPETKPLEPVEDQVVKDYETQEQNLLDEKTNLEAEKVKIKTEQENLKSHEYSGIWKGDPVTPADYEAKKDSIQGKKDFYTAKLNAFDDKFDYNLDHWELDDVDDYLKNNIDGLFTRNAYGLDKASLKYQYDLGEEQFVKYVRTHVDDYCNMIQGHLDDLTQFEAQGKSYVKLSKKLTDVDDRLLSIDDEVKTIRSEIMKLKGIDPEKMQSEIDDIVSKIGKTNGASLTIQNNIEDFPKGEINKLYEKVTGMNSDVEYIFSDYSMKYLIDGLPVEKQTTFKKELKKLVKNNADEAEELKKLQKELKEKQDELDKIKKRYGLEDDKFSQKRKDNAYWFTDDNGSTEAADKVLRDKCGEVWRNATKAQRDSAFEYTRSYHKYNEPLRGIEYGTNKFLGVGNVDLDDIGVSTGYGFKKGEVKKLIDDLTDIIDKSTYDHDMWFQRGTGFSGMDKFFNVGPDDFYNLSEKEMQKKLLGTTPTEFGFMSTSVAKGKGLNLSGSGISLNIYAPKGTKYMYMEPFSAFGRGAGKTWDGISKQSSFGYEAEALFQRNTQFRVIKVEKTGSRWYIDMEVIDQKR